LIGANITATLILGRREYTITLPTLLSCPRCYTDASIIPDTIKQTTRKARLGVLIVNSQMQPIQNIYIQGSIDNSSSVLLAEAAALLLAASMADRIHLHSPNYLSDNQQLVSFFNGTDHSSPPDWRIKNFTHQFMNYNKQNNFKIFKIRRQANQTAHLLAKQAFAANHPRPSALDPLYLYKHDSCKSVPCRGTEEPLHSEPENLVTLIAARCC
jgi:hypothetical protein